MKLSVYFTPLGLDPKTVAGRPVLVIDVLRTTTTIVTALGNGAKAVVPADSAAEAMRLARNLGSDDVVLAGERNYERIEGFQLGNSPGGMTSEVVDGKTIIMTTTNGTVALLAADYGGPVIVGSAVNFAAAAKAAKAAFKEAGELVILCAGRERRFALEDAYVAGRFAREIVPARSKTVEIDDAGIAAQQLVRRYGERWQTAVAASAAARKLKETGFKADVAAAIEVDKFAIVPLYAEKQVKL